MVPVGDAGRYRAVVLVVALAWGTTGCGADSDFQANDEDARRLGLLRADPLSVYLGAPAGCTETLARYVPSDGLPLSFPGVENNTIRCPEPSSGAGIAGVVAAAEAARWEPALDYRQFQFAKQFGDVWARAKVITGPNGFHVNLTIPPHTHEGDAPVTAQLADGQACADAIKAGQPRPANCEVPAP